ncbi:MAG TPA: hypothetical protein VGD64_03175, partial [Acidisarcina sp.]
MPSLADPPLPVLTPGKWRLWSWLRSAKNNDSPGERPDAGAPFIAHFAMSGSPQPNQPPVPRALLPQTIPPSRHRLKTDRLNFSATPALFTACCFASGILADKFAWRAPFSLLVLFLMTAVLAAASTRRPLRTALLPLATAWLILGMICAEIEPAPDPQTALIAYTGRSEHLIQGRITRIGPARLVESIGAFSSKVTDEYSQQIDLNVTRIGTESIEVKRGWANKHTRVEPRDPGTIPQASQPTVPMSGGIGITLYAPAAAQLPTLGCGTTIQLTLAIHQPDRYLDP